MKKHISKETLISRFENKLSKNEKEWVSKHLKECSKCAIALKKVGSLIELMRNDDSADAPENSIQLAKNIFEPNADSKKGFVKRILATMQMHLSPLQPSFNERGSKPSMRQTLYQAGENSLDIRVSGEEDSYKLDGQILGTGFVNAQITLSRKENEYVTTTNELSEFVFNKLGPGNYDLKVTKGSLEILLRNLEIE